MSLKLCPTFLVPNSVFYVTHLSAGEKLRPLEGVRVLDLTRYECVCSHIQVGAVTAKLTGGKCVQGSGWTLCHHDPGRPGS